MFFHSFLHRQTKQYFVVISVTCYVFNDQITNRSSRFLYSHRMILYLAPLCIPHPERRGRGIIASPHSFTPEQNAPHPAKGRCCTRGRVGRARRRPPKASGVSAVATGWFRHKVVAVHKSTGGTQRAARRDRQESGGAQPFGRCLWSCGQLVGR